MTDPITGKPTGSISRTYLDRHHRKIGKAKSLGGAGGIIRLSPDEDVLQGLTLAEGLETGLAALFIGLRPVWSTGSNTNMAKFPLLAGVESLTILADHDAAGAGERAAREVEARWRAAGTEVAAHSEAIATLLQWGDRQSEACPRRGSRPSPNSRRMAQRQGARRDR